ncbi:MAG: hypothetical protein NTY19_36965 [Planctomycetota bacterium]|nr:hypothetical protein [Planctomycetota bacterium]
MPDPVTVSNSSCLIGLDLVGQLDLLHGLYGTSEKANRPTRLRVVLV